MNIIQEDYVSYEVAKLLKEKGMDAPFFAFYRTDEKGKFYHHPSCRPLYYGKKYIDDEVVAAFTLQMACKWLMEVHHIHIKVNLDSFDGIHPIYEALYDEVVSMVFNTTIDYGDTYEEAVETAIKFCLETLI